MDRGSGEALQKTGMDKGQIAEALQCMRWDKAGPVLYCLILLSTSGEGLSISPTTVQESHAYYLLLKKSGKISEGTKQAIRAAGLITEIQKYSFGNLALFAANQFQQPIRSYHTSMLLYVS